MVGVVGREWGTDARKEGDILLRKAERGSLTGHISPFSHSKKIAK
jgi:hypothetical protein